MKEYIVTKYIYDSYGNTIGERRLTIPQETVNEIRKDERAKVFEEIAEAFNEHLFDSPMINPIMTRNEILLFLEQLKEQKNDGNNSKME